MRGLFVLGLLFVAACTPCAPEPCPPNAGWNQSSCSCDGPPQGIIVPGPVVDASVLDARAE